MIASDWIDFHLLGKKCVFFWGGGGGGACSQTPPTPPPHFSKVFMQNNSMPGLDRTISVVSSSVWSSNFYHMLPLPPPPTSTLSQFSMVKTTVASFTLCPLVSLYCAVQTADKAGPAKKETTPSKKRVRNTRPKGDKPKRRRIMTPDSEEEDSGGYLAAACLCKFKVNTQGS